MKYIDHRQINIEYSIVIYFFHLPNITSSCIRISFTGSSSLLWTFQMLSLLCHVCLPPSNRPCDKISRPLYWLRCLTRSSNRLEKNTNQAYHHAISCQYLFYQNLVAQTKPQHC